MSLTRQTMPTQQTKILRKAWLGNNRFRIKDHHLELINQVDGTGRINQAVQVKRDKLVQVQSKHQGSHIVGGD